MPATDCNLPLFPPGGATPPYEYSNFALYQGRLLRGKGKMRVLGRGVVPRVKTAVSCNQWPACVAGLVTMSDGET